MEFLVKDTRGLYHTVSSGNPVIMDGEAVTDLLDAKGKWFKVHPSMRQSRAVLELMAGRNSYRVLEAVEILLSFYGLEYGTHGKQGEALFLDTARYAVRLLGPWSVDRVSAVLHLVHSSMVVAGDWNPQADEVERVMSWAEVDRATFEELQKDTPAELLRYREVGKKKQKQYSVRNWILLAHLQEKYGKE